MWKTEEFKLEFYRRVATWCKEGPRADGDGGRIKHFEDGIATCERDLAQFQSSGDLGEGRVGQETGCGASSW